MRRLLAVGTVLLALVLAAGQTSQAASGPTIAQMAALQNKVTALQQRADRGDRDRTALTARVDFLEHCVDYLKAPGQYAGFDPC